MALGPRAAAAAAPINSLFVEKISCEEIKNSEMLF
jgi:hypothetical protein